MSAAIEKLKTAIENAQAILVGAGSGFSTAAGYTYSGGRFHRHFADFIGKYHFRDMYSAGFYHLEVYRSLLKCSSPTTPTATTPILLYPSMPRKRLWPAGVKMAVSVL